MKGFGIRARILAVVMIPATIIASVLGIYFSHTRLVDLDRSLKERGKALAGQVASAAEYGVFASNRELLDRLTAAELNTPDVVAVTIRDADGQVLSRVQRPVAEPAAEEAFFTATIRGSQIEIDDFGPEGPFGDPAGEAPVLGSVELVLSTADIRKREREIITTGVAMTLVVMVFGILLALRLSRNLAQPIVDLTRTVEALGRGNLRARARVRSAGELGTLERGINAMASRLEKAQNELEAQIEQATAELRETLEAVEIKNVELDLARKRAQRVSREKSEFLANMSHEIRTPMNGLLGFVDLLLRTPLSEEQRDYATTIRKSATNLLMIVNDILDLSKIESGKLTIEKAPFDLREALEDAMDLMAPVAHQKGLELVLLIYSDVPLHLQGDVNRFRQVLLNLIGNGIKFTTEGSVVVRVMLDDAECPEGQVAIRISITDTGIGLTREQQEKLFVAFSQADPTLSRQLGGTGLGLFISKNLVERMGGRIGIESEPGEGSTFWFTLTCQTQETTPTTDTQPAVRQRRQVFIQEPHELARLALHHLLESCGLETKEFETMEALERALAAEDAAADLILLGLPPGELEEERLGALLERLKTTGLPVLVLINSVEHERLNRVMALGADACLSKPPRREALLNAVQRLLKLVEPHQQRFVERRKRPRPQMPNLSGARVLVADDNQINRKLISLQIRSLGVRVDSAPDGTEALALAQNRHYDLILMDIHMPGMNGEEVTRAIRDGNGPNRDTPVIALTANVFAGDTEKFQQSGINECLVKPVSEYHLWEVIKRWTQALPEEGTGANAAAAETRHAAVIEDMRDLLKKELPAHRRVLEQAWQEANWPRLQQEAHKLNGSAAYCRLDALRKAAATLETAAREGRRDAIELAYEHCLEVMDLLAAESPKDVG